MGKFSGNLILSNFQSELFRLALLTLKIYLLLPEWIHPSADRCGNHCWLNYQIKFLITKGVNFFLWGVETWPGQILSWIRGRIRNHPITTWICVIEIEGENNWLTVIQMQAKSLRFQSSLSNFISVLCMEHDIEWLERRKWKTDYNY